MPQMKASLDIVLIPAATMSNDKAGPKPIAIIRALKTFSESSVADISSNYAELAEYDATCKQRAKTQKLVRLLEPLRANKII